jgi:Pyruvate/2-oxoacid:ferredoxin oxidoreductase gamma subunit
MIVNSYKISPKNEMLLTISHKNMKSKGENESSEQFKTKIIDLLKHLNARPFSPKTTKYDNFHYINFTEECMAKFNSLSYLNFVMLGYLSFFISHVFNPEDIELFISEYFMQSKKSKEDKNIEAFKFGMKLLEKYSPSIID